MPCNGRFPFLICIATIFIGSYFVGAMQSIASTLAVLFIILLGVVLTLLISKILSKTILKGMPTSFILELPANEIVLPIILMSYMGQGNLVNLEETMAIKEILLANGWNLLTGINVMIFTLLHFPCGTTLLTVKKEAGGWKWAILSFLLPTVCGIVLCTMTTLVWNVFAV